MHAIQGVSRPGTAAPPTRSSPGSTARTQPHRARGVQAPIHPSLTNYSSTFVDANPPAAEIPLAALPTAAHPPPILNLGLTRVRPAPPLSSLSTSFSRAAISPERLREMRFRWRTPSI